MPVIDPKEDYRTIWLREVSWNQIQAFLDKAGVIGLIITETNGEESVVTAGQAVIADGVIYSVCLQQHPLQKYKPLH